VVTDTLPGGLTFESAQTTQGTYYLSGRWNVGTLDQNTTAALTITAKVNAGQGGQTITNEAEITSTNQFTDTNPGDNQDSVDLVPVANADMELTAPVDNSPTEFIYTLTASNNGPDLATQVMVNNFLLPTGLTFDSYAATKGIYTDTTGIWEVGSLASGLDATLTVTATIDSGQTGETFVINNITVSADQIDLELANNTKNVQASAGLNIYLPIIMK
jgi:uncharacterized repeat protein (TIGR01451 family)